MSDQPGNAPAQEIIMHSLDNFNDQVDKSRRLENFDNKREELLRYINAFDVYFITQVEKENVKRIFIDVAKIKQFVVGQDNDINTKKESLSKLISDMVKPDYSATKVADGAADGAAEGANQVIVQSFKDVKLTDQNASDIILEQYVKQNVVKILTIVYAYLVLLEKVKNNKLIKEEILPGPVPPGPKPQPKPKPTIFESLTTASDLFGNLFDPFLQDVNGQDGQVLNFVDEIEKNEQLLGAILSGELIPENTLQDGQLKIHLTQSPVINIANPSQIKGNGYDFAVKDNIETLKEKLRQKGQDKDQVQDLDDNIAKGLVSLLRHMQYYRAKQGGSGPGSDAATNDLLKFVLTTFPIFTQMGTKDVQVLPEGEKKQGGFSKKSKKHR
jgi:hypothetical protein